MADFKERLTPETVTKEKPTLVDLRARQEEVPKEIKSWLEKIEEDPQTPTVRDDKGQVVLMPTKPATTVGVTRSTFLAGFKKTAADAGRWLSVFLLRLIKLKRGNITFKAEE